MDYVDEYRNPKHAKALIRRIDRALQMLPDTLKPIQVMEVCGGHTHTLFKFGLLQLLPDDIEFVHGPGCPVCVLSKKSIDQCIALAEQPNTILCSFGDAMRVPGSDGCLADAKARGLDVRMVYSPMDALKLAQTHVDKQVIFFALGFETTMPATAITLQQAKQKQVLNFKVYCQHITIMPVLSALLSKGETRVDGFLLPGHLSMIIGTKPYQPLADTFRKPCVITGFEPLDMLQAILMLLTQFAQRRCEIENQYSRVVTTEGNQNAQRSISEVFCSKKRSEWMGLGEIPDSGIELTEPYRPFSARVDLKVTSNCDSVIQGRRCGDVLAGRCKPTDCPAFAVSCFPENALGSLMVSGEGACAAYYHYCRD
ncbi:hydrogenase formation protein HypD [Vibrio hangzhouensis]|uniref:Hydrogenase maturation factor n=1 Tax=Vibrio hangzhouensis TaxID=462991 RepID=A0A1H5RNA0_9VIBR|nr:hydrogenase formation protein HypD [Vibrio hangzhouensis]SEF39836.1 Hydrogenase maturation protein HypD [Vibrio hangzhouensis]